MINIVNFILDSLEKNATDISTITDMLSSVLSSQFSNTNSVFFGLFPYSLSLDESDYITPDYDFQPLVLLICKTFKVFAMHRAEF